MGANMSITNQAGETPRDVARRFSKLACVKLLGRDPLLRGEQEDVDGKIYNVNSGLIVSIGKFNTHVQKTCEPHGLNIDFYSVNNCLRQLCASIGIYSRLLHKKLCHTRLTAMFQPAKTNLLIRQFTCC